MSDMHRARMLADHLPEVGWDVEVLTTSIDFHQSLWIEPETSVLRPNNVIIHEAKPSYDSLYRTLAMRSANWRALWPLYKLGVHLLRSRKFDLVYISTTQFNLFCLGRLWLRKVGVPYVLDFHDPWVRETQTYITTNRAWKLLVSMKLAQMMEPYALRTASGIVSVSPNYIEEMARRYPELPGLQKTRHAVIPFGATKRDFILSMAKGHSRDSSTSGTLDIVYVGAGRGIMAKSFRRVVQVLARQRQLNPDLINRVRIRLFGTYAYWKPGDVTELADIAQQNGVGDLVEEYPARIGYLKAMNLIREADGLLVLGVDDPAYMPSKLFTFALTGKPLLACLHRNSQANAYFAEMPKLGHLIAFEDEDAGDVDDAFVAFLREVDRKQIIDRWQALSNYLAPAMACRHAVLFEECISR
jgi:hypothetical protein